MAHIVFLILAALVLTFAPEAHAKDVEWSKAGSTKIALFYPGVTSWEFLTSDDHRLGGKEIKQGKKDCRHCHLSKEGELDLKADEIASGAIRMKRSHSPFEPEPMPGKKGVITATVQAVYDSEFLYVRVEWPSKGAGWSRKDGNGAPDRVSLQLNKNEQAFKKYGCFVTCHNDLNTMPSTPSKKEVESHPLYRGFNRSDVRLYAFYAKESWSDKKNEQELQKRLRDGGRIDLWAAELEGGAVKPYDGWVFDDRLWEDKSSVEASGAFSNGKNVVVFKRKLDTKDNFDIALNDGETASVSLAIHEDGTGKRKHYVSFPFSIGIGADAELKAEKIK